MEEASTGAKIDVPPSGAIAGTYAYTDTQRGVHKAPAGLVEGFLDSALGIQRIVTKGENDILHQASVNVIRKFPEGILVWGARTLSADPEWKYVNVRRLFIFLEQSIERGTQWVVFEPNDASLWASIRRNVSAFLRLQWREGRLAGLKEEEAFFVQCDETTNPPEVVDAGQVVTLVGVAPLKPAEFVVFRFQQMAGRAAG
jgi:phage tail sheath protein FI